MDAASESPLAPIQSQSSPRSRHSRRSSAARGFPSLSDSSPPPSVSGTVDQEQFVASSFSTPSDFFPSEEARTPVGAASSLTEDGSTAGDGGGSADSQPESSDYGGATKKPAWNKPSNGATVEVGTVMGADSWPALSESARASPKASSTDSLKALSHGSLTLSQEITVGSLSSQKEVNTSISTTNSTSNHVVLTRQRSMKRGSGSSSHSSMTANGSLSQAPPMQGFVVDMSPSKLGKSISSVGESPRDNTHRDAGQRGGSYGGNDPHQQRGSFRRSNSGPQSRGDGSYHHSYGSRRDLERGKQDWTNTHRNFGSRESLAPQQRVGSRPFIRSPISNSQFISAPPPPIAVRPFVPPMVYTEMPSPVFYVPGPHPDSLRPMSMLPIAPMFYSIPDPHLPSKIVNQIDYYFSSENLVRDTYLRQNMDGDGWVPISLIATFKKVALLTDNIQLILDTVQASNVVEVQGDKVRRKSDWNKWIIPPVLYSTGTSPRSLHKSSQDMLAAHIKNVTLDDKAAT